MKRSYKIATKKESGKLVEFFIKNGQALIPMVELIEQSKQTVDELVDELGRAAVEAVLRLSASNVAGPPHPGKKGGEIRWHGAQQGTVALSNRKLIVSKPRLRKKGVGVDGEVPVPAYESMQDEGEMSERMHEILMRGVSSRNYESVIGEMADSVGVKKSSVSKRFIKASALAMKKLCERRFDDVEILVIYIDGQHFGKHNVINAIGVDVNGKKHALGLYAGATENGVSVKSLLEDLMSRGINPERRYLFVIDGSKALRHGINAVFGSKNPVQRCRIHKLRNVLDNLPEDEREQSACAMRAAWKLDAKEGMARLLKLAEWLDREHHSAAASLREGLEETFTVNRLGLPANLRRCLSTTNLIESPQSGVRMRTRRVCRWRSESMVMYWAASALLETEKKFRKLQGYRDLWMLKAALKSLEEDKKEQKIDQEEAEKTEAA